MFSKSSRVDILRALFAGALLVLSLSGCGFHLRGAGMAAVDMPVTFLQNDGVGNEFVVDLRRALRSAGTELATDAASAAAVLTISRENRSRRVLSVGSTGKVQEYELYYAVTFSVSDNSGKELVSSRVASQTRAYAFDETDVLAKQSEESLLYRDMRRDVISEILRHMQKLGRKSPGETGG